MVKLIYFGIVVCFKIYLSIVQAQSTYEINGFNCTLGQSKNNPYCKWTTTTSSIWTLGNLLNTWNNITFNGPNQSPLKAKGILQGSFIYVYKPSSDPTVDLLSPVIQPKTTTDCFSFYYYIYGEEVGNIELSLVINGASKLIWKRDISAGDMWHLNRINIGPQNYSFQLKFNAISGWGAIGLGYLGISPGICDRESLCDFESGNCNWVVSSSDPNCKFKLIQASDSNWPSSLDPYDHTTDSYGHFMEAYGGNSRNIGEHTNLTSPKFEGYSSWFCLQFWYWRHSSQANKIDVFASSIYSSIPTQWSSNYSFPINTWHRAQLTFFMYSTEWITIRATKLIETPSPIDIDDISLIPGTCPEPITCNFNKDLCGWTRDKYSTDLYWDHGIGRVHNSKALPDTIKYSPIDNSDHYFGMYIYSDYTALIQGNSGAQMSLLSEFVPATNGSCFKFDYFPLSINKVNTKFNIYLTNVDGLKFSTLLTIDNTTTTNKNDWYTKMVNIKTSQAFRIVIQLISSEASTYLAIDNISYKPGICQTTTTATTNTIPVTVPPVTSLSCDFEQGTMCGWSTQKAYPANSNWTILHAYQGAESSFQRFPKYDHTKSSSQGQYASLSHDQVDMVKSKQFSRAVMSVTNNELSTDSFKNFCFSFWYFMNFEGYAQINVTVVGTDNTLVTAITKDYMNNKMWNLLQVETPGDKKGYVYTISAYVKLGVVAIDDIIVRAEHCYTNNPDTFLCTFEGGHNCSFSPVYGIYDPHSVGDNWKLFRGYETSVKTIDHTLKTQLGHYFAMDFAKLNMSTYEYKVMSGNFKPTTQSCVTFSYFMTELNHNESLSFYVINSTSVKLWSVSGDLDHFWYSHRMTISSSLNWKIQFSATTSNTKLGVIAIDDVIVETGKTCPPKGKCDFERKDTCMWGSLRPNPGVEIDWTWKKSWVEMKVNSTIFNTFFLQNPDFEWSVYSPDGNNDAMVPPVDHTIGKASGTYLLMKGMLPRTKYDRAILVSDHYDIVNNSSFCFTLYYYFKTQSSATSARFEIYQAENNIIYKKLGEVVGNASSTSWSEFKVTASPMSTYSKNLWFYLVGDVGTLDISIAIDDISIQPGSCPTNNIFQCKPSTQTIPKNKVCDGVRDCANGADELDCGSCDFINGDVCGFSRSLSATPLSYKWRVGNSTYGPKSDPNGGSNFLVAQAFEHSLVSPVVSSAYTPHVHAGAEAGCMVYFQYNMNGQMTDPMSTSRWEQLSIYLVRVGFEDTQIWNSDALKPVPNVWNRGQAIIGRVFHDFYLGYTAVDRSPTTGPGNFGFIALTNLKMIGCSVNRTGPPPMCNNAYQFRCKNGQCVYKSYVCDSVDDCNDGSDETGMLCSTYKLRCDFEYGLCDWGRYQIDSWTLSTGFVDMNLGPTRDHSKGIKSGHFLALRSALQKDTLARITGPTLEPSESCRIRFWYSMEGNETTSGKLTLGAQSLSTGYVTTLWTTYPSQFPLMLFGFIRREVTIPKLSSTFRIVFTGSLSGHKSSKTMRSWIAIDDISFTPECIVSSSTQKPSPTTPTPTPNPCGTEFMCKTDHKCINKTQVCDFQKDCSDGSDESSCGTCNFEGKTNPGAQPDYCGWHNIGYGKKNWIILQTPTNLRGLIASADAKGNQQGHYLILSENIGGTSNSPGVIISPMLGATGPDCKITFYYRHKFIRLTYPSLTVILYNRLKNFSKKLMEIKANNDWKKYSVHIGKLDQGYQIQISGNGTGFELISPYIDQELDEISFDDCSAKGTVEKNELNCDFENSTCGWYDWNMGSNTQIDWERTRLEVPYHDHTSRIRPLPAKYGTWIFTQWEGVLNGNNTATLMSISPQPVMTKPKCLTFWYYMFDVDDQDNFTLILNDVDSPLTGQPRLLWIKRQSQSNNWLQAQVNVPPQTSPYYLIFRAVLNGRTEKIGLDDISYTDGNCPDTQICDFEVDFCKWTSTVGYYKRFSPIKAGSMKYPPIDHTMGAADGYYVKVNVPNQVAILSYTLPNPLGNHTGIVNIHQPKCLKLWYYMGGPPGVTQTTEDYFNISTTLKQNIDGTNGQTIKSFNNQNQWLYRRVSFSLAFGQTVSIKAQTSGPYSIIAFDDIQIQKQSCEQPGWCDFENDFCGWSNAHPLTNTKQVLWMRNSGTLPYQYFHSNIKYDHTTHTDQGYYLYVPNGGIQSGTAVLQSEILGPFKGQYCFSFYYFIQYIEIITIIDLFDSIETQLKVEYIGPQNKVIQFIGNISSHLDENWHNFQLTINNLPQGRFRLTSVNNDNEVTVAIDDISIKPGVCGQSVTTLSTPTTPIPNGEWLWDCNFETSSCKWKANGTGWNVTSWEKNNKVGPRVDHSMRTSSGHYLLYSGDTTNAPNPVIYSSDPLTKPFDSKTTCISLWYYIDSESKFNLTLGYYTPFNKNFLYRIIRTTGSFESRSWKQLQQEFTNTDGNVLSVQLEHSTPFVGSIAIDDIKLNVGHCKYDNGEECGFNLNFCNYVIIRRSVPPNYGAGWCSSGQDKNVKYGPLSDHTTGDSNGYFFWFTKPYYFSQNTSYETQMIVPNLTSSGLWSQCLRFWYQINTPTNSSFQIFVAPTNAISYKDPLWVVPYTNFNQWTRGQLTIYENYAHKVVFDLVLGAKEPNTSFIALDDISLTSGRCEPPISCDFDMDMCSWNNIRTQQANWNWAKFTGPPGLNTVWFGPNYDHTLQRRGGTYLYITVPQNNQNIKIGVIESMITPLTQTQCLSFWSILIGTDAQIEALVVRYGKNVPLNNQTYSLSKAIVGTTLTQNWIQHKFLIDPKQFPNTTVFSVRIRGSVQKYKSFIALDDIMLSEGQCSNIIPDKLYCKYSSITYNVSQRCNFVKDCPLGDDEKNCGNCDFEKDSCIWFNKNPNGEQWVRKAANYLGSLTGPNVDGSGNKLGYYLIVDPHTKLSLRADLITNTTAVNQLKSSYFTCKMNFKYYMSVNSSMRNSTIIAVNVNKGIYYSRTVWRMTGQVLDQWTNASANIGEQDSNFNVEFMGSYPGQTKGLAIDDIQFVECGRPNSTTGSCPQNQIKCKNNVCMNSYGLCDGLNDCGDYSDESLDNCRKLQVIGCTFESQLGSSNACNWTQEFDSGSNALWQTMTSVKANTNQNLLRMTGPTFDRTFRLENKGTFMVLKGQTNDYGKKTKFITRMLMKANGQTCALRLFYYMFGTNVGSLTISVRYSNQTIKSKANPLVISGNKGQQWIRAVYPYSDQKAFQFVIEGQVGNGRQNDIAIDDISFSEGCLPSDQMITTVSPNPNSPITPTKSHLGDNPQKNSPSSKSGKIAAGVLVPLLLIGAILGFLYYRRYKQRLLETDREPINQRVYYNNEGNVSVETK